jgi:LysM repeat protein
MGKLDVSLHRRTLHKLSFISLLCLVYFALFPLQIHAQNYPGTGLFSYQCEEAGILFFYQGNPALWTSYQQARQKLELAIQNYQNQAIITLKGISLWALGSNEFQIHRADNPEATKLVLPSSICGTLTTASPQTAAPRTSTGLAFVQSSNDGSAVARVDISPAGGISIYVEVNGNAYAYAFGQSKPINSNGQLIHTVRAGENLFRIALAYGSSVNAIAAANNISDVTRIYVGQQLLIP